MPNCRTKAGIVHGGVAALGGSEIRFILRTCSLARDMGRNGAAGCDRELCLLIVRTSCKRRIGWKEEKVYKRTGVAALVMKVEEEK